MKAYIVGENKNYLNFIPDIEIVNKLKEADIVVFGDGPAVSPSLYKSKKLGNLADVVKHNINRDRSDKSIYTKMSKDQVAIGIGRGSGFLAVMNGAKLIQYSIKKDPGFSQDVRFSINGKTYEFSVLSNNLQPIYLDKDCTDYNVFGISKSTQDYFSDNNEAIRSAKFNGDPEVIKFNKKNSPVSICIQFRPDLLPESHVNRVLKSIIYASTNK